METRLTSFLERLPLLRDRRPLAYATTLLLAVVACVVRLELDHVFPPGFPFLTFFPAVIGSSFLFGRGPGIFSAVLCGLLSWYLFIPPFDSFALGRGTATAMLFYTGVVGVDVVLIHWMQRATGRLRVERERSASLAARTELLFHELQHRVSNNLQMVGAVLTLQKRGIADPDALRAIDDASRKLQLIGRIQRQLYGTSDEAVEIEQFLRELAADVIDTNGKPGIRYELVVARAVRLPSEAAIPVALIMAEAIANAVEHGFDGRDTGLLRIGLAQRADHVELSVEDDGNGLPPGFDAERPTSLGLKIARTLAGQLGGDFRISPAPGGGTCTRLTVPSAA